MTIAATVATIKAIPGMTARCRDGEWRVTFTVEAMMARESIDRTAAIARCEDVAAYETDAESAIDTARAMAAPAPAPAPVKVVGYIDMTPTWSEILPTMLHVMEYAEPQGKEAIRGEFVRMAALADKYVAAQKALKSETIS